MVLVVVFVIELDLSLDVELESVGVLVGYNVILFRSIVVDTVPVVDTLSDMLS